MLDEAKNDTVRQAHRGLLDVIGDQIEESEEEIERCVERDATLKERYRLLDTISGVGPQTAAIVISELGFLERFASARQAAAHAGLAPSHRESGTSVRRTPRMLKVGNGRLRRAMCFPAMTSLQHNPAVKVLGNRPEE
jgi:Transposase IS116/IS110/IS902 family.